MEEQELIKKIDTLTERITIAHPRPQNACRDVIASYWAQKRNSLSETTQIRYEPHLLRLAEICGDRAPQPSDVAACIEEHKGAGTRRHAKAALAGFFRWASAYGIYHDIAANYQLPKYEAPVITAVDTKDIMTIIDSIPLDNIIGFRDRAIFMLCAVSGLRVSEVSEANRIHLESEFLRLRGKGHRTVNDIVPIAKKTREAINDYLQMRDDNFPWMFCSYYKGGGIRDRMSIRGIQKMVKERGAACGVSLHVHQLRHSAITDSLKGGGSLSQVRLMARHKDLNTIVKYDHSIKKIENPAAQIGEDLLLKAKPKPKDNELPGQIRFDGSVAN